MMKNSIAVVGVVLLSAGAASADLVMHLNNSYTGSTPAASAPWLTASFSQTGTDSVRLTLTSNVTGWEVISTVFFNVADGQSVAATFNETLSSGSFQTPTAGTGLFAAGGGSVYDMRILFPINQPANRFGAGDVAVFDLTGEGLTESDFNFLSGGALSNLAAAHVQAIGPNRNGSGWIADGGGGGGVVVPLPPAAWAGLIGLAGAAGLSWSRRRAYR